jgi:hypothetical protein
MDRFTEHNRPRVSHIVHRAGKRYPILARNALERGDGTRLLTAVEMKNGLLPLRVERFKNRNTLSRFRREIETEGQRFSQIPQFNPLTRLPLVQANPVRNCLFYCWLDGFVRYICRPVYSCPAVGVSPEQA